MKKNIKLKMNVTHYTTPKEISDINNYLDKCASSGKLRAVRRDKTATGEELMFANYKDGGMYLMSLNKKGYISKVKKF